MFETDDMSISLVDSFITLSRIYIGMLVTRSIQNHIRRYRLAINFLSVMILPSPFLKAVKKVNTMSVMKHKSMKQS